MTPEETVYYAYKRIKAWEEHPQTGVRLKMMYHPDLSPLAVMFSFQHPSGPTRAVPVKLSEPDFIGYFTEAERMYLEFAKKANKITV